MSVLREQIKELREKAELLRGHVDGLTAPLVVPSTKELIALTMLDSANRMEDAADTIESMRGKLQMDTRAERTCHNVTNDIFYTFMCSECGYTEEQGIPDYCAGCGAEVKHG